MPAYHVSDDISLYRWVVDSVTGIGGNFTTAGELVPIPMVNAGNAEYLVVKFQPHVAEFADGSKLTIKFTAQHSSCAGWEYVTYKFDYRSPDDALIFRFDKHREPKWERKFGTRCHVHLGDGPHKVFASGEVEIDDVIGVILDYQRTGEVRAA